MATGWPCPPAEGQPGAGHGTAGRLAAAGRRAWLAAVSRWPRAQVPGRDPDPVRRGPCQAGEWDASESGPAGPGRAAGKVRFMPAPVPGVGHCRPRPPPSSAHLRVKPVRKLLQRHSPRTGCHEQW